MGMYPSENTLKLRRITHTEEVVLSAGNKTFYITNIPSNYRLIGFGATVNASDDAFSQLSAVQHESNNRVYVVAYCNSNNGATRSFTINLLFYEK